MGFSVSSPGIQQLQRRWASTDVTKAARHSANHVALDHLVPHLHAAAKASGASADMLSDIGVFPEADGSVSVGVPSGGATSQEALDLEYGTAVGAPKGWMRATIAQHRPAIERELKATLIDLLLYAPK